MNRLSVFLVLLLGLVTLHQAQAQRVADPGRDMTAEIQNIRKAIADRGAH